MRAVFRLGVAGAVALGYALAALLYVHAQVLIDEPDSMSIESVRAYSGTINSGDMLVVIEYRIDYDTLPALASSDAYLCRFFVDDAEVNAVEIVAFNNLGYGLGVCSMYFTDTQRSDAGIEFGNPSAEDYEVLVQGKPSAFADPPQVRTSSITYRSAASTSALLLTDIADLAEGLENDPDWLANGFDLITFTLGQQVLTTDGEAYFGQAVPNIQIMIPDLFGSSTSAPQVNERDFGTSERDRLLSLWDSSPLGPVFSGIADDLRVGKVWVLSFIGILIVIGSVILARRLTGDPEFGMIVIPFAFPLSTAAGFGTMTAVMFVAALCFMGVFFSLFLRRTT